MAVEAMLEGKSAATATRASTPPPAKRNAKGPAAGASGKWLAARHVVVLLVFASRVTQTILRMAMGALVIFVCEDLQCGAGAKGWLLSAHAAGYCSTQVVGGHVADRLGGKRVVSWALALSGLAVAATPMAAGAAGLQGIAACQVVMGVAMGPLFPASIQLLAKWLPPEDRALASTALDSGITLGSLIVVPLSGVLAVWAGWRFTFVLYGLIMVAYAMMWAWLAADTPEDCGFCDEKERDLLASVLQKGKDGKKEQAAPQQKWAMLSCVVYARLWAIYGSHFTFNYAVYFVNSWSATYYLEIFGLRPEQAGLHLSMPHIANSVVKVLVNPGLERTMKGRGSSNLTCRRTFSGLGFVGVAAFLGLVPLASGPTQATACFSLALAFLALHPSGFKANYMDVTVSRGGLVSGIGNTVGSAGSTIGPLVVAYLKEATGGWGAAFQSVVMFNLAAAALFCALSSTVPIETSEAASGAGEETQKKEQ